MQLDGAERRGTSVGLAHRLRIARDEGPGLARRHLGRGRAASRHRAGDVLWGSQRRRVWRHVTLAVLIHRTLGRTHSRVRRPHTGTLQGATVDIFYNPLVVRTIDGLMHLVHAFLREVGGTHGRHRV